ncbi:triacylglycerol lipase [Exophiala viscosa]|uniref:Triacylglycerol lipase n=1 Tax=Exophiala viscosa TaxID=2486360 RepID=A0AAN6DY30_9EURO|nr:triacylglycerol lipase [Exophiala viscosa]
MLVLYLYTCLWSWITVVTALPAQLLANNKEISQETFESLEELARIVDISYCVGTSGIHRPFKCLSRCSDFEGFELVTTWNTGPLLSDSCGYIAVSHPPHQKRVIVAFRGTYSIANTIADLSTNPAEYAPFPSESDNGSVCASLERQNDKEPLLPQLLKPPAKRTVSPPECPNCTVHAGFMTSWKNTRCTIVPHVEKALNEHPDYELVLVGHSLGGAVAALAALEFQARGWVPHVTTFGEPRIGNKALNQFIDKRFNLNDTNLDKALYRRVTHVDDPVPLLPLQEWGYGMHAGELYISKPSLPPARSDIRHCQGDEDPSCIAKGISTDAESDGEGQRPISESKIKALWGIGTRYKLWELFFAHRDYFWRLGLCVPGGDPWDWSRGKYNVTEMNYEL